MFLITCHPEIKYTLTNAISGVGIPGATKGNRDRGKILWQSCWIAWSIQHGIYTVQDNVDIDNEELELVYKIIITQ
jgi:hypothetical protein